VSIKALRIQSPNTPKSHYHTKKFFPKKKKQIIQTFLLLGQTTFLFLFYSLTVKLSLFFFFFLLQHILFRSLCATPQKTKKKNMRCYILLAISRELLLMPYKTECNCPFIKHYVGNKGFFQVNLQLQIQVS
jgi:hypothetical protein